MEIRIPANSLSVNGYRFCSLIISPIAPRRSKGTCKNGNRKPLEFRIHDFGDFGELGIELYKMEKQYLSYKSKIRSEWYMLHNTSRGRTDNQFIYTVCKDSIMNLEDNAFMTVRRINEDDTNSDPKDRLEFVKVMWQEVATNYKFDFNKLNDLRKKVWLMIIEKRSKEEIDNCYNLVKKKYDLRRVNKRRNLPTTEEINSSYNNIFSPVAIDTFKQKGINDGIITTFCMYYNELMDVIEDVLGFNNYRLATENEESENMVDENVCPSDWKKSMEVSNKDLYNELDLFIYKARLDCGLTKIRTEIVKKFNGSNKLESARNSWIDFEDRCEASMLEELKLSIVKSYNVLMKLKSDEIVYKQDYRKFIDSFRSSLAKILKEFFEDYSKDSVFRMAKTGNISDASYLIHPENTSPFYCSEYKKFINSYTVRLMVNSWNSSDIEGKTDFDSSGIIKCNEFKKSLIEKYKVSSIQMSDGSYRSDLNSNIEQFSEDINKKLKEVQAEIKSRMSKVYRNIKDIENASIQYIENFLNLDSDYDNWTANDVIVAHKKLGLTKTNNGEKETFEQKQSLERVESDGTFENYITDNYSDLLDELIEKVGYSAYSEMNDEQVNQSVRQIARTNYRREHMN